MQAIRLLRCLLLLTSSQYFAFFRAEPSQFDIPLRYIAAEYCHHPKLDYARLEPFALVCDYLHLNASLLIDSGASVKTVQACMGHSMASTTLNIYAHSFRRSQAIASEAVAENFNLL